MEEQEVQELRQVVANLMGNTHNLEIALIASNSRLSLSEKFNEELAKNQIHMQEVLSSMVQQLDQLKASQNILAMQLKQLQDSRQGSGSVVSKNEALDRLQQLRNKV